MRNTGLEAIRAMAALMVFFAHAALIIPEVHETIGPVGMLLHWGTEAVVLFFMLSGVVIRISHDKTPRSAGRFLWTRGARLLPLYLTAVVFSVLVLVITGATPDARVVLGNVLFLQSLPGFIVPVIPSNSALWSLAFEAFFYLAFALCLTGPRKPMMLIWSIVSMAAVVSQFPVSATGWAGHLQQVLGYSSIWILGYHCPDLARRFQPGMICALAWFGLLPMASRLSIGEEYFQAGRHLLVALTTVPLFIFVLRNQAGENDRERWSHWIAFAAAYLALGLASCFWSQSLWVSKVVFFAVPLGMIGLAWVAGLFPRLMTSLKPAALLGGQLSYAVYLFHMPVFALAGVLGLSGLSGAFFLMPAAALLSCVAEFYIHPALSRLMFPRPATAAMAPLTVVG